MQTKLLKSFLVLSVIGMFLLSTMQLWCPKNKVVPAASNPPSIVPPIQPSAPLTPFAQRPPRRLPPIQQPQIKPPVPPPNLLQRNDSLEVSPSEGPGSLQSPMSSQPNLNSFHTLPPEGLGMLAFKGGNIKVEDLDSPTEDPTSPKPPPTLTGTEVTDPTSSETSGIFPRTIQQKPKEMPSPDLSNKILTFSRHQNSAAPEEVRVKLPRSLPPLPSPPPEELTSRVAALRLQKSPSSTSSITQTKLKSPLSPTEAALTFPDELAAPASQSPAAVAPSTPLPKPATPVSTPQRSTKPKKPLNFLAQPDEAGKTSSDKTTKVLRVKTTPKQVNDRKKIQAALKQHKTTTPPLSFLSSQQNSSVPSEGNTNDNDIHPYWITLREADPIPTNEQPPQPVRSFLPPNTPDTSTNTQTSTLPPPNESLSFLRINTQAPTTSFLVNPQVQTQQPTEAASFLFGSNAPQQQKPPSENLSFLRNPNGPSGSP